MYLIKTIFFFQVQSPGYPSNYHVGDSACYFKLVVKVDELIVVVFNETDLFYNFDNTYLEEDVIEVFEGFEDNERLIARFENAFNTLQHVINSHKRFYFTYTTTNCPIVEL